MLPQTIPKNGWTRVYFVDPKEERKFLEAVTACDCSQCKDTATCSLQQAEEFRQTVKDAKEKNE